MKSNERTMANGFKKRDHPIRLVLMGYGPMGRAVEELAAKNPMIFEIANRLTGDDARRRSHAEPEAAEFKNADIAIDFSTPEAAEVNIPTAAKAGLAIVLGTSGIEKTAKERLTSMLEMQRTPVVAATNFAVGMHLFLKTVSAAAEQFLHHGEYEAWIRENEHEDRVESKELTSTGMEVLHALEWAGHRTDEIDINTTRHTRAPREYTVGFDGPADGITMLHTVRDREAFAHGALLAAEWLMAAKRPGWTCYSMNDVLKPAGDPEHDREPVETPA